MSIKRVAATELNHDNWDHEQKAEEPGEFQKASEEELNRRVKRTAKRRLPQSDADAPISSPFSGFSGFGTPSTSFESKSSPFGFLTSLTGAKTNGSTSTNTVPSNPVTTKSDTQNTNSNEYLSKVKSLNLAFMDWIKSNIEENPLINLSPVFKDYDKYMKDFEELKSSSTASTTTSKESSPFGGSTFSFGAPLSSAKPETKSFMTDFKFGSGNSSSIFSSNNNGMSSSTGMPAPTFANTGTSKPSEDDTKNEDNDDEPPKNDFVPVVEEKSIFSKRCKVFVKTSSDYADRGVGTLYLKHVEDSKKVQLIVRADTNLGNILLNIMVVDGLPVSRLGKNNVMIVCIPTPESKPPPTPVLLRVKTSDEADELLEIINKNKS